MYSKKISPLSWAGCIIVLVLFQHAADIAHAGEKHLPTVFVYLHDLLGCAGKSGAC